MPRLPVRLVPSVAAILVALAAAPAARAAPGPADPLELYRDTRTDGPAVFVGPTGEQFVWFKSYGNPQQLAVAVRAGGVLTPLQQLSLTPNAELPTTMAFTPDGASYTPWGIATSGALGEQVMRPAGGPFGALRETQSCGRFEAAAYGPGGRLGLACSYETTAAAPHDRVGYAFSFGDTGIPPSGLSSSSNPPVNDPFIQPQVAWSANGSFAIGWHQDDSTTTSSVRVLTTTPSGTQAAATVATASGAGSYTGLSGLVALTDGRVVVTGSDPAGAFAKVVSGTSAGPRIDLGSGALGGADAPQLDATGLVHLLVTAPSGSGMGATYRLTTRVLDPGTGALTAPVEVAPPAAGTYGRLVQATDDTERVLVRGPGGTSVAVRSPGGAFSAPVRVAGPEAGFADAALTPTGDVVVAWNEHLATDVEREVIGGLDSGTPPAVTAVSAPEVVLAGQPARFSATATDPMGIGTAGWELGDGTARADGGAVDHTFATAGTYAATFTAADRARNTTTVQRTVRVVDPAQAPAGSGSGGGGGGTGSPSGTAGDTTAPSVGLSLPRRTRFAALRQKGIAVDVTLSEAATLRGTLSGRSRRVTLRAVGDVALATRSVKAGALKQRLVLKPKAALLGRRARKVTLRLEVTATDAAGHATTATRTVEVAR